MELLSITVVFPKLSKNMFKIVFLGHKIASNPLKFKRGEWPGPRDEYLNLRLKKAAIIEELQ